MSSEESDLVSTWLASANLSYAIPNFRMAGIVSPRSFVELGLDYFEPLGVTKADDRKRLFYLIHHVKGVIKKEEGRKKGREGALPRAENPVRQGGDNDDDDGNDDDGDDDEYASEEFQSPPPNSKDDEEEVASAAHGGDEDVGGRNDSQDMMSSVEIRRSQPISPVTLSSPIASEDGHFNFSSGGVGVGGTLLGVSEEASTALSRNSRRSMAASAATGSAKSSRGSSITGAQAAAAITSRPTSTSTRERLERELELRALKRRQEKLLAQQQKEEEDYFQDDDEFGLDQLLGGDSAADNTRPGAKQKSSKRRQSSIPAASNGGGAGSVSSVSRRHRSSIASHRPREATEKEHVELDLPEEEPDYKANERKIDELDACFQFSDGDTDDDSLAATPKNGTSSSSAVDVRARSSSIGMHGRQTVKRNNATNGRKKNRRLSNIPRAAAPILFEEDEEDEEEDSVASETSDLSASVQSYRSLGNGSVGGSASRRSSVASTASTVGSAAASTLSGILGGVRTDENRNNDSNQDETRRSSRKKHPLSRGGGQHAGTTAKGAGGGSVGSSSLRGHRAAAAGAAGGKKRLSTIPSSAVAPLSPLAGLSSTQLDESINAAADSRSAAGPRNLPRRRSSLGLGGKGDALSSSGGRPGSADSNGSRKPRSVASGASVASGGSHHSMPSLRDRPRRKLNVSTSSGKGNIAGTSVASSASARRRRLKTPTAATRPRSKSPYSSSRGTTPRGGVSPPRSANRSVSPKRTPPQKMGAVGAAVSPRANRSASPKRTPRNARSPPKLGVVGNRPLSPVRSPNSRTASPSRSPGRIKSPVGGNGAVFVHGAPVDDSFVTQIGQLRQAFDDEHERLMGGGSAGRDENEDDAMYEMRIRVIVRKRPMSGRESSDPFEADVIHPLDYDSYGRILVHQPKTKLDLTKEVETTAFAFDNVFDENSNNAQIYERAVMSLIPGVFRGKWASVFAYGQTGSGKTFTMMGSNATGMRAGNQSSNASYANLGLYFLAAQDVFRIAENPKYADLSIGVSLFEIYGGKLLDLLNARNPVRCLENSKGKVCFPGLSEHPVNNAEELMDIIDAGALNRSTGTTSANADSSRSHAVLQLSLRKDVGRTKNKEHGRLTFIDLAGSERGADTSKACRITRMEGAEINTSLLALKEVIRALATGSSLKRIPFRGSKLTQVLKESFVGKNSRTVMVSCVAPNMRNCDHTLNTLRYADRVKERDAQTGKLSSSVAASSRIKRDREDDVVRVKLPPRPLTAPAASFRIAREDESDDEDVPPPPTNEELLLQSLEEDAFVEEEEEAINNKNLGHSEFEYDNIVESDENDSLEEALKSNANLSPDTSHSHHNKSTTPRQQPTSKDTDAAQSLILTHKSIMSKLLQMLQREMSLVNDTDANRENIDEYLKELENISGQQLGLLSTLRESLASYNASKELNAHASPFNHSMDDTTDYDDSFDLRD